jgi:hypothetical protein
LYLAYLGLGILLWGLLFGWWDGFFFLGYRTFCWMFMGITPINITADALAYGLNTGLGLILKIVFGVLRVMAAGWMLVSTLNRR